MRTAIGVVAFSWIAFAACTDRGGSTGSGGSGSGAEEDAGGAVMGGAGSPGTHPGGGSGALAIRSDAGVAPADTDGGESHPMGHADAGGEPPAPGIDAGSGPLGDLVDAGAGCAERERGPFQRGGAIGTNGEFFDECTSDGKLVAYRCEEGYECSMNCAPTGPTGKVVSNEEACQGDCADGICFRRCPAIGDDFEYVDVGPLGSRKATLRNRENDVVHDCSLTGENTQDTFDCESDVHEGLEMLVSGILSAPGDGSHCEATTSVQFVLGNRCTYACTIQ